jgi:hypothetical protein
MKGAKILISDAFQGVLPCYRDWFEKANKLDETDKTKFIFENNDDNTGIIIPTVVVSSKKRKRDIEKK